MPDAMLGWFHDPVVVGAVVVLLVKVFAASAWHKWRDPAGFALTLGAYRLLPEGLVRPAAVALAWAETALVPALVVPATRPLALLAAAALLAVYAAAMTCNLARGRRDIDCGCGADSQPLAAALPIRNGVLIALALLAARPVGERPLEWPDALLVVVIALAACLLHGLVDELIRQGSRLRALQRATAHETH